MGECLVLPSRENESALDRLLYRSFALLWTGYLFRAMTRQKLTEREAPEGAVLMEIIHATTSGP